MERSLPMIVPCTRRDDLYYRNAKADAFDVKHIALNAKATDSDVKHNARDFTELSTDIDERLLRAQGLRA
jgi:hypothetical protein